MVARQKGSGELGEKDEGTEKYRLIVPSSHGEVKCSTANTVNSVVITVCAARWGLEILGGALSEVYNCLITGIRIPEINTNNIECKLINKTTIFKKESYWCLTGTYPLKPFKSALAFLLWHVSTFNFP